MSPQNRTDSRVKASLALVIAVGFFGVIAGLFFTKAVDGSIKDVLLVMLGALITSFKEITGFFFGSSSGSAAKSATIEQSLRSVESNPLGAEPVAVKVDTSTAPVAVRESEAQTKGIPHA